MLSNFEVTIYTNCGTFLLDMIPGWLPFMSLYSDGPSSRKLCNRLLLGFLCYVRMPAIASICQKFQHFSRVIRQICWIVLWVASHLQLLKFHQFCVSAFVIYCILDPSCALYHCFAGLLASTRHHSIVRHSNHW